MRESFSTYLHYLYSDLIGPVYLMGDVQVLAFTRFLLAPILIIYNSAYRKVAMQYVRVYWACIVIFFFCLNSRRSFSLFTMLEILSGDKKEQ